MRDDAPVVISAGAQRSSAAAGRALTVTESMLEFQ